MARSPIAGPVDAPNAWTAGRRIVIVGQTCAGKSTLGDRLAAMAGVQFVELDALYWKPGWVGSPDDEFGAKLSEVAAGDGWIVAGNYHRHTSTTLWPWAQTVVWLDLPLSLITWRVLRRSWVRWRSGELLWGTNKEKFWDQLKLWKGDESLIAFAWRHHREQQRRYVGAMSDPQWAHIRFIRLRTTKEIARFTRRFEAAYSRTPSAAASMSASTSASE